MVIINAERHSGKTEGLIFAAYATGALIVTPTKQMAEFIEKRAQERGYDIPVPMEIGEYLNSYALKNAPPQSKPHILIDEAVPSIIEQAQKTMLNAEVLAITMSAPQIKRAGAEAKKKDNTEENG